MQTLLEFSRKSDWNQTFIAMTRMTVSIKEAPNSIAWKVDIDNFNVLSHYSERWSRLLKNPHNHFPTK
jgi:hypothetical protein